MPTNPFHRRIQQRMAELQGITAPENGFANYKEFLEKKHLVRLYPFSEELLYSLINIAFDCYINRKRFNKQLILEAIKGFYYKNMKVLPLPEEIVNKLFILFKGELDNEKTIVPVNFLLKGQRLNDSQIDFLISNAFYSTYALNRVLQYTFKSDKITNWIRYYYDDKRLSQRRMEITSWLIDTGTDARPSRELLYSDMEIILETLRDDNLYRIFYSSYVDKAIQEAAANPDLEIKNANYLNLPLNTSALYTNCIQNNVEQSYITRILFLALKRIDLYINTKFIVEKLDVYESRLYAWAIAYSRIDMDLKIKMLKQEFRPDLINSYLSIGVKIKSVEFLEWLMIATKSLKKYPIKQNSDIIRYNTKLFMD